MSDRSNALTVGRSSSQACEVEGMGGFEEPSSGIAISKARR